MTSLEIPNLKSKTGGTYAIPTPTYNIHYLMYHDDMLPGNMSGNDLTKNNKLLFQIDNGAQTQETGHYIGTDEILGPQSKSLTVNENAKKLRKLIKQRAIESLNKAYNKFRNERQRANKDTYSDDAVGLKLFRNKNEDIWNEFKNKLTNPKLYKINNKTQSEVDNDILTHFEEDVDTIPKKRNTEGQDQSTRNGFINDIYGLLWDNNSEYLSKNVHQYKYKNESKTYTSYYFLLAIYFFDYGPNLMAMSKEEIDTQNEEWKTYFNVDSNRIHLLVRDFMDRYEANIRKNDIKEASEVYKFQKLTWDKYSVMVLGLMCLVLVFVSGKWMFWLVDDCNSYENESENESIKSNFLDTVSKYYKLPIVNKLSPQANLFVFATHENREGFQKYSESYYPTYATLLENETKKFPKLTKKYLFWYLASVVGATIDGESKYGFNWKPSNYHILRWYEKLIRKYNSDDKLPKRILWGSALILPILFVLYNLASPVFTPYTDVEDGSMLANRLSTTIILWASVFTLFSVLVIGKVYYHRLKIIRDPTDTENNFNNPNYWSKLGKYFSTSKDSLIKKIGHGVLFICGFIPILIGLAIFAGVQVVELGGFVLYLILRCLTNVSSSFPLNLGKSTSVWKWLIWLVLLGLLGLLIWYVLTYKRKESKEVGLKLHYTDPLKYTEGRLDRLRFDALFTYFDGSIDGQATRHFGPFTALLVALSAITVLPSMLKYFFKLTRSGARSAEHGRKNLVSAAESSVKVIKKSGIEKRLLAILVGLVIFMISFLVVYFEITKRIISKDESAEDEAAEDEEKGAEAEAEQ